MLACPIKTCCQVSTSASSKEDFIARPNSAWIILVLASAIISTRHLQRSLPIFATEMASQRDGENQHQPGHGEDGRACSNQRRPPYPSNCKGLKRIRRLSK